jgi:hypothetical protein
MNAQLQNEIERLCDKYSHASARLIVFAARANLILPHNVVRLDEWKQKRGTQ